MFLGLLLWLTSQAIAPKDFTHHLVIPSHNHVEIALAKASVRIVTQANGGWISVPFGVTRRAVSPFDYRTFVQAKEARLLLDSLDGGVSRAVGRGYEFGRVVGLNLKLKRLLLSRTCGGSYLGDGRVNLPTGPSNLTRSVDRRDSAEYGGHAADPGKHGNEHVRFLKVAIKLAWLLGSVVLALAIGLTAIFGAVWGQLRGVWRWVWGLGLASVSAAVASWGCWWFLAYSGS